MGRQTTVRWDDQEVSAILEGSGPTGILLAHGAGTNQSHPTMAGLRSGLSRGGHTVMSFNYPYTERGSKRPDRQDKLLACHRAAADHLAERVETLYLAGRSMGGRMGTYLAADGYPCHGLVLYAYPLHPAGKPEKLRIEQFEAIRVPMLFLQGTRDALSRMDLFDRYLARLPGGDVVLLEGAGHGARGGGWNVESMTERYVEATLDWIDGISSGRNERTQP